MDTITRYLRNGEQLDQHEWRQLLKSDLDSHVNSVKHMPRSTAEGAVMFDIWNRHKVSVNGSIYEVRIDYVFDTASDVMADIFKLGDRAHLVIMELFNRLPDDLVSQVVEYIPDMVRDKRGKFVLMDNGKDRHTVRYYTQEE